MQTHTPDILLSWKAPEKTAHQRSERWYVIGSCITATMIVYGILSGTWSMSISFALLAGLFFLIRNEEPPVHEIALLDIGIRFNGQLHSWSEWKQFWILQGKDYHELHIETKKRLRPDLVIQTGDIDPYQLRDVLSQYIPQTDEQKERILDAIIRFCKL